MRPLLIPLFCVTAFAAGPADTPIYDRTAAFYTAERLPAWLKLSGEFRTRVEGRTGFGYQPGNDDAYGLVRTRINVELLPADWLDFYFQGQDSRAPGLDAGRPQATFRDPFDLRQAYVRFGGNTSLWKLTVGRQLLSYGAQRLIGPLDWTNTSRAWDAVKLELGTADAKVDLFASSVVTVDSTRWINHHRQGFNIHGAYGSFKKVAPKAVLEPYLLWKTGGVSIWTGGLP
jgi:Alginate export